jgi:hypothetical protein
MAVGIAAIPDQARAGDPGMTQGPASNYTWAPSFQADMPSGRYVNAYVWWTGFTVRLGLNSGTPSGQNFTTYNVLTCPGGGAQIGAGSKSWSGITTAIHETRCPGYATPAWIVGMIDLL